MRVAVLCGGRGTRLGEPIKCLTEVAGRPFMDWKLEQLERMGASKVVLWCGPYVDEFRQRYGSRCDYDWDDQQGIGPLVDKMTDGIHWTMGDVLLEQPLEWLAYPTMYVRRDDNPNIAGLYLDCGLYFGKRNFRMVETWAQPWHINTPEDLRRCDENLRRLSVAD